jgi:hypothetical protein
MYLSHSRAVSVAMPSHGRHHISLTLGPCPQPSPAMGVIPSLSLSGRVHRLPQAWAPSYLSLSGRVRRHPQRWAPSYLSHSWAVSVINSSHWRHRISLTLGTCPPPCSAMGAIVSQRLSHSYLSHFRAVSVAIPTDGRHLISLTLGPCPSPSPEMGVSVSLTLSGRVRRHPL